MLMIQNNLDYAVAQHPHELMVETELFSKLGTILINNEIPVRRQTLTMYSGHPMGLFPSHKEAPRVVVTNGMVIPNYSKPDDWEK
jgi:urocanate hydratase